MEAQAVRLELPGAPGAADAAAAVAVLHQSRCQAATSTRIGSHEAS